MSKPIFSHAGIFEASEAFSRGRDDYLDGFINACPFDADTKEAAEWHRGVTFAMKEEDAEGDWQ